MTDLTKIEKPFGRLDPEAQAALQAWPHGWEYYGYDGVWYDRPSPSWVVNAVYRAKPAPRQPREMWIADKQSSGLLLGRFDSKAEAEKAVQDGLRHGLDVSGWSIALFREVMGDE